jgi:hypothetical protein
MRVSEMQKEMRQWMRQCYMLMTIRRACDYASLLVGWLVDRKGRTGPSGADQPDLKREETKKRVGKQERMSVTCRTTKVQLARFGHTQIRQIRAYNTLIT